MFYSVYLSYAECQKKQTLKHRAYPQKFPVSEQTDPTIKLQLLSFQGNLNACVGAF